MNDNYKPDEDYYGIDDVSDAGFFFVLILGFLILIIGIPLCVGLYLTQKPTSGYGGSPGHMSPMEVEELYNKNRK